MKSSVYCLVFSVSLLLLGPSLLASCTTEEDSVAEPLPAEMPKEDSTAVIDKLSLDQPQYVTTAMFNQYVMGSGWYEVESHEVLADGTYSVKDYWEGNSDVKRDECVFEHESVTTTFRFSYLPHYSVFYIVDMVVYDEVTGDVTTTGELNRYRPAYLFRILYVDDQEMRVLKRSGISRLVDNVYKDVYIYMVYRKMTKEQQEEFKERALYFIKNYMGETIMDNPISENVSAKTYEGKWNMYGHTIGDGKLKITDTTMEFVLPEDSLLSHFRDMSNWAEPDSLLARYPNEPFYGSANPECGWVTQQVKYTQQGTSDLYHYVNLNNGTGSNTTYLLANIEGIDYEKSNFSESTPKPESQCFFFGFTIEGVPYRVDLSGENGATAMHDLSTDQWTVMLAADTQKVFNLRTGEMIYNWHWPWSENTSLYFVTTKKIQ